MLYPIPWNTRIPHLHRSLDRTKPRFGHRFVWSMWKDKHKLTYVYNAAGNVSSKYKNGRPTYYEYDASDSLTKAVEPFSLWNQYSYDAVGNMTEKTIRHRSIRYHYNEADQLVKTDSFRYLPFHSSHLLDDETRELKEHHRRDHLWKDDMWNSEDGLGFMSPVEVHRSYDDNGNLIQKSYQGHNDPACSLSPCNLSHPISFRCPKAHLQILNFEPKSPGSYRPIRQSFPPYLAKKGQANYAFLQRCLTNCQRLHQRHCSWLF